MSSPPKRPRDGNDPPPLFMGYSAERYFNKLFDSAGLIKERNDLQGKLAAAEARIAELEQRVAELEGVGGN